jgi:hypothetical protein
MSRNGDEDDTTPRFDDKSNSNNNEESSKTRASTDVKSEDLMKRLEKFTAKNNKLRRKVKAKRAKGASSSSKEEDFSYEEEDSKKGKKERNNHDKPSYNSMLFNYDNMPSTTVYTSIPIGKAPYFDGTCYNQWKHCMKNYLYSISPNGTIDLVGSVAYISIGGNKYGLIIVDDYSHFTWVFFMQDKSEIPEKGTK